LNTRSPAYPSGMMVMDVCVLFHETTKVMVMIPAAKFYCRRL